jgi:hypothetical protein
MGSPRRRSIFIVTAAATALGLATIGWLLLIQHPGPSYSSLRLAIEEEIPGSVGFFLHPPPATFRPSISPDRARVIAARGTVRPREVLLFLASVPVVAITGRGSGDVTVWVLVARGICYFDNKGDLVSSARSAPAAKELPDCTRKNLSAVLVDATTGKPLAAVRGYDLSGTWRPPVGVG